MNTPLNKSDVFPVGHTDTWFVQIDRFATDPTHTHIQGSVGKVIIGPNAPLNCESETITLIPYAWYEYVRVTKTNPETRRTGTQRINEARKKVKAFASGAKTGRAVLRIVKDTIVTKLKPDETITTRIQSSYLDESYASLIADSIASARRTTDPGSSTGQRTKSKR